MTEDMDRRAFLKTSAALSGAAAFGMAGASEAAQNGGKGKDSPEPGANAMPTGKIGDLEISRLISGGNLIGGWAHSRDLIYVSQLMKHYNTPEKIMETLKIMEEHGINTLIADLRGETVSILHRYWDEMDGNIQWVHQGHTAPGRPAWDIKRAVDNGACAVYIHGGISDKLVRDGNHEVLGTCMDVIREAGVPCGIGAHDLDTVIASETAGYDPDFYMKTLHHHDYWSARNPQQLPPVIENRDGDNYWAQTPEQTIEFMKGIDKPWIAFKVLAAGAIRPQSGFSYAFENGADFICVGMFDWQVSDDALVARRTVSRVAQNGRERSWYA